MTPLIAALGTAAATIAAWKIAVHAARSRRIVLGNAPAPAIAAAAALAAIACTRAAIGVETLAVLAATSIAAVTDRRCGAIFDRLTLALAGMTLLAALAGGTIGTALAGGASTGGATATLFALTRGRGIGLGDVKLAAGIGSGLGCTSGLAALAIAFVAGGAYGAALLATGRARRGDRLPFAPFLAAGSCGVILVPGIG